MTSKLQLRPVKKKVVKLRTAKKVKKTKVVRIAERQVLSSQTLNFSNHSKLTIQAVRNPGEGYFLEGLPAPKPKEEVGNFTCNVYTFTGMLDSQQGILNRAATENIYPGAIYPFDSIADGRFNDVDFRRKPIELTSDNDAFKKQLIKVNRVNRGEVLQAIADMRGGAKPRDAKVTRETSEKIYSNEQFFMTTSGAGHYLTIGGSHTLDFTSEKKTHKYFVQFYQEYYTISVNDSDFGQLEDFFVTKEEAATDPHAIPARDIDPNRVMIDSVTYGRMFHLVLESEEDLEAQGVDVNAFAEFGLFGGHGSLTEKEQSLQKKVTIVFGAIGGDIETTAKLGNPESVKDLKKRKDEYFSKPGSGSIIGYTLRTLDGDLVGYKLTTEFTARQCAPRASKYRITWQQIICKVNDDSDSTEDIKAFARIRVISGKGKDILDEQKRNGPLLEWEQLPDVAKKLKPKPWTFTAGSVGNPIELPTGGVEKVDKAVTFAIPKDDRHARIAIRADVVEIDDTSSNVQFGDKTWERKVEELGGAEKIELVCHHEDSRIAFQFHIQSLYE